MSPRSVVVLRQKCVGRLKSAFPTVPAARFRGICRSKSVACNRVLRPCYVPRVDLFMPLNKICSIAKMLISLGLRSDVFLAKDKFMLPLSLPDSKSILRCKHHIDEGAAPMSYNHGSKLPIHSGAQ